MDIQINMLNVGDADAIIVHLVKSKTEQLVILIDGGHPTDGERIGELLDELLKKTDKKGPDLVICTHYDADHIGGLQYIAEKYQTLIGEFWIHEHELIKPAAELAEQVLQLRKRMKDNPAHILNAEEHAAVTDMKDVEDLVLESYPQMVKLVDYLKIHHINKFQPFAGSTLQSWEDEIKVLGPTIPFYDKCVPKIKHSAKDLIKEEAAAMLILEKTNPVDKDPCEMLGNTGKTVTYINQISIILQILVEGKKYIFTGDASLESFRAIPDYETALADIYWLKVPHHGSPNNSSPDMFNIMKPTYADISGGTQYLKPEVPGCLKAKGTKVRSTLEAQADLQFPY
ncbi:ComEC/Rec2 family competence protein [Mucilaginibacter gotjawali]|uniref:Beta-lactamase superfamily II metal-dependent hydrolase n=2 Tax=Mucilaginibacter gotjawali TaxID=1550579 RepID=A0A839SAB5_9SPHI|nr:MBL fold metallo-hydrolase [Mucilaginibacter gotjawali]MBB3054302.1 beta-lactamase superfamily II metal-dependent hydrolase [Mucilaginibacter gotjawali]BAU51862.1 ComEC family competence protein [Mucilaginibacter gotjawali]